ncbi:hypothetical protein, partial [Bacteroides heparinolyticus]
VSHPKRRSFICHVLVYYKVIIIFAPHTMKISRRETIGTIFAGRMFLLIASYSFKVTNKSIK